MESALARGHELHARTYRPVYQYTFKWTIENISTFPNGVEEKSPPFCIEPDSKWYVIFQKSEKFMYLCLHRNAKTDSKLEYTVTISDINNQVLYERTKDHFLTIGVTKHDTLPREIGYLMDDLVKTPNDQLLFTLLLKVEASRVTIDMNHFALSQNLQKELLKNLSSDLKILLDSNIGTDITLNVQGENLTAHKAILSARSSVFSRMFQQELTETKDSLVYIEDINVPTIKALIRFMYSGNLVDYDFNTALELYYAADKYAMTELRDICGRILVSKMDTDTAVKVLYLADRHNDKILKDNVTQYIIVHHKPYKNETVKDL